MPGKFSNGSRSEHIRINYLRLIIGNKTNCRVDSALLPLSKALRSSADLDQRLDWALAGGDDYELLFTLPDNIPLPDGCKEMGRVVAGSGISCDRTPERIGYDHFRR